MIDEKKLIDGSTWYPDILFKTEPTYKDGWNNYNRNASQCSRRRELRKLSGMCECYEPKKGGAE